jgi:hypothetical protein
MDLDNGGVGEVNKRKGPASHTSKHKLETEIVGASNNKNHANEVG